MKNCSMTERKKYPRTPHLSWSPGRTVDDKAVTDYQYLMADEIVVLEKMDGENTTLYPDGYTHARSIDSKYHPSRTWIKNDWASKSYMLPPDIRIVGENMYARHSIHYTDLTNYFYGFAAFQDDYCLDWDMTVDLIHDFGYPTPRLLYRGAWQPNTLSKLIDIGKLIGDPVDQGGYGNIEGYVVRTVRGFPIDMFGYHVAKYVRSDHVQSDNHWMHQEIVKNELRDDSQ